MTAFRMGGGHRGLRGRQASRGRHLRDPPPAGALTGEVKEQAADFTHDQIDRDVEPSKRLGADVHLLATVADIPEQTSAYAQERCDANGLTLTVLGRAELRLATQ